MAAFAHLLSAVVVFVAYKSVPAAASSASVDTFRNQLADPDTPGTCNTAGVDEFAEPDQCNVELVLMKPKPVVSVNIVSGAVIFFLITWVAHWFYATDGFGSKAYSRSVAQGWNPYRWLEYGLSATLMTILIALADGTRDFGAVLALAIMTMAMQFCGFAVESGLRGSGALTAQTTDSIWGSTVVGWLLFVGIWLVQFLNFGWLVSDANSKYTEGVPVWIWYIVIAQFLYYASFGIVQWMHIKKRTSGDSSFNFAEIEKWYIYLSFFSKLSLAGGLAYGLIWRVKDCPAPE